MLLRVADDGGDDDGSDDDGSDDDGGDDDWELNGWFYTEDRSYVQDYWDTESKPARFPNPRYPGISQSHPSLHDVRISEIVSDEIPTETAEQSTPIGSFCSEPNIDASTCTEGSNSGATNDNDYVYYINHVGKRIWIRNPAHVLKDRVRTKLRILLEAGCDPNEIDDDGQSASDYAGKGLWPQWLWALETTGYVFDEEDSQWVKQNAQNRD